MAQIFPNPSVQGMMAGLEQGLQNKRMYQDALSTFANAEHRKALDERAFDRDMGRAKAFLDVGINPISGAAWAGSTAKWDPLFLEDKNRSLDILSGRPISSLSVIPINSELNEKTQRMQFDPTTMDALRQILSGQNVTTPAGLGPVGNISPSWLQGLTQITGPMLFRPTR